MTSSARARRMTRSRLPSERARGRRILRRKRKRKICSLGVNKKTKKCLKHKRR